MFGKQQKGYTSVLFHFNQQVLERKSHSKFSIDLQIQEKKIISFFFLSFNKFREKVILSFQLIFKFKKRKQFHYYSSSCGKKTKESKENIFFVYSAKLTSN